MPEKKDEICSTNSSLKCFAEIKSVVTFIDNCQPSLIWDANYFKETKCSVPRFFVVTTHFRFFFCILFVVNYTIVI